MREACGTNQHHNKSVSTRMHIAQRTLETSIEEVNVSQQNDHNT